VHQRYGDYPSIPHFALEAFIAMTVSTDQQQQLRPVGKFFSDFAATWDSLYDGRRSLFWRWFDRTFRNNIFRRYGLTFSALGSNLANKRILDIGCGSGVYCFEAASREASWVIGIDGADGMIALCRERSRRLGVEDRVHFVRCDFPPASPVAELQEKYNVAIVMGVMDYVDDPAGFLKAVHDRVSDFAVISFPGKEGLRWRVRRWRYRLLRRCPVFFYTEPEVRAHCKTAGFRNLEVAFLPREGGCYFIKAFV